MIQIFCDICHGSKKFQCSPNDNFTLCFTTIELKQICDGQSKLPMRSAVVVCANCRDAMIDGGREGLNHDEATPIWDRFDDCMIKGIQSSLKSKKAKEEIIG